MRRELGFDARFLANSGQTELRIALSFSGVPDETHQTHISDMTPTIPAETIEPALLLFAAMENENYSMSPYSADNSIVISLPAAALSEPWRAAILLNLIDFATAEEDVDLKLVDAVSLASPALADMRIESAYSNLESKLDQARSQLKSVLPDGFWLDQYEQDNWPEDADEYYFDVTIGLSRAISDAEIKAISTLANSLELIIGWMGFAFEGTATGWQNRGKMLYAGDVVVEQQQIRYSADHPPSDISLAILMLVQILDNKFDISVTKWDINISDS